MKLILTTGLLSLIFFLFNIIHSQAQEEKVNFSAGVGYPEAINLGVRYQMVQSQLGIHVGGFPLNSGALFSIGGDYYYHFEGTSAYSDRKPWYGKLGLNYHREKDDYVDNKYTMLVPRIGRDFNLSSKLGISLEAGLGVLLNRDETEFKRNPNDEIIETIYGVNTDMPDIGLVFGLNFFYRL